MTQEEHDTLREALEKLRIMMTETPDEFERRYWPLAGPVNVVEDIAKALSILEGVRGREGDGLGDAGELGVPVAEPTVGLSGSTPSAPVLRTSPTIPHATQVRDQAYSVTHSMDSGQPWGLKGPMGPLLLRFNSRGEAASVCNELNDAYSG